MTSKFLLILIISIFSFSSFAQEEKAKLELLNSLGIIPGQNLSPDQIRERMRQAYDRQREYLNMRIEIMSEPETAKLLAKFSRTYYEALIKEGFSSKEAMQLVIGVGIPRIQ